MNARKALALAVAATALGGGLVFAPSAHAASASPTAAHFEAQARNAGLTTAQATGLQRRVDTTVAQYGGKQVAANSVQLASGGTLVVTVPGENSVRNPHTLQPDTACPYGDFCAYKGTDYTGYQFKMGACGTYELPGSGWGGSGSWINNQTQSWMTGLMYDHHMNFVYQTPPPPSSDPNGNWKPIWYINNC
ncbi:peptidase inhibitor family I36 protein [Streptantibioticus rubrisoli]|uniref:Peptidase inhibitor family I36 n=1 Tax=Streptantibioticus rubrisoli TaxID=1387313 RepID=A0ABT1PHZ2_9ACTN|nr:peptidase inhibitor family I36 protein [Streptantibioticus rubrisoli]MCQ4044982.1 hypothetical protein [Streptantibioticus rubrisoli]